MVEHDIVSHDEILEHILKGESDDDSDNSEAGHESRNIDPVDLQNGYKGDEKTTYLAMEKMNLAFVSFAVDAVSRYIALLSFLSSIMTRAVRAITTRLPTKPPEVIKAVSFSKVLLLLKQYAFEKTYHKITFIISFSRRFINTFYFALGILRPIFAPLPPLCTADRDFMSLSAKKITIFRPKDLKNFSSCVLCIMSKGIEIKNRHFIGRDKEKIVYVKQTFSGNSSSDEPVHRAHHKHFGRDPYRYRKQRAFQRRRGCGN